MAQAPRKGSPPPRPRRYFRAAEIRYLARKQSARDKSILLFRLRRKLVAWGEFDAKHQYTLVQFNLFIKKIG